MEHDLVYILKKLTGQDTSSMTALGALWTCPPAKLLTIKKLPLKVCGNVLKDIANEETFIQRNLLKFGKESVLFEPRPVSSLLYPS